MDGCVDAWISGIGSAGTFTGVSRFLKRKRAQILCVAVEPQGSVLEGGEPGEHKVEGIGVSFIPATFDRSVCDRVIKVVDPPAFEMVKRLASETGVFAGSSAGAMVCAAVEVARELGAGKRVVTVIPDSAERYLSKGLLSD
jgi:cysteine synthase